MKEYCDGNFENNLRFLYIAFDTSLSYSTQNLSVVTLSF